MKCSAGTVWNDALKGCSFTYSTDTLCQPPGMFHRLVTVWAGHKPWYHTNPNIDDSLNNAHKEFNAFHSDDSKITDTRIDNGQAMDKTDNSDRGFDPESKKKPTYPQSFVWPVE